MFHQNNDDNVNPNDGVPEGIPKPEKFVDTVSLICMESININIFFIYFKLILL